jgi:hypothetical protein
LPETGFYGIRVLSAGANWNFTATDGETFGLAWRGIVAVPEPLTVGLVGGAVAVGGWVVWRRRRQQMVVMEKKLRDVAGS